jgi:hypothetical protein
MLFTSNQLSVQKMKFLYGPPPENDIDLIDARKLEYPSLNTLQGIAFGIGALLLALLAAVLWATSTLKPFIDSLGDAMANQSTLVYLAAIPLTLVVHEVVHCLAYPNPLDGAIGFLPKSGMAYAWYGKPLTRARMCVILLAPATVLTAIALTVYCMNPSVGLNLLPAMLFNLLSAGGDIFGCYTMLRQVPAENFVQLKGTTLWWGKLEPAA